MPNRFIFSLRFSTKVFWKLGVLSLVMAFFMSLFRANLYFLSVFHATPEAVPIEIFQAFWVGFRFDLLIMGFVMVPITILLLVQSFFEKWPRSIFLLYKIYFFVIWLVISALSTVDFFFFARFGRHMRWRDYDAWSVDALLSQAQELPWAQWGSFCAMAALLLLLGWYLTGKLKFGLWKDEYSPDLGSRWEVVWRTLLPLILVFLAARGTVTAHHLELADSDVSENPVINELALNAVWCFDK